MVLRGAGRHGRPSPTKLEFPYRLRCQDSESPHPHLEDGSVYRQNRPTELAARIRAALRRLVDPADSPEPFALGGLAIEYRLLFELSVNAGRVLTHDELLERVWGFDHRGGMSAVRSSVKRLRGKLDDDASNPTYIFAVPRVGYRMPRGETQGEE